MNLDKERNAPNSQEGAGIIDLSFEIIFITKYISLHGNSTEIAFLWGGPAVQRLKTALVIQNPFLAMLLSPGVHWCHNPISVRCPLLSPSLCAAAYASAATETLRCAAFFSLHLLHCLTVLRCLNRGANCCLLLLICSINHLLISDLRRSELNHS
jgi:hypothetical protein